MILARAVYLLRLHLNDVEKVGWPDDDELIEYLDRATSFLTDRLITMRYNSLIKVLNLEGPTPLPADFVAFVGKVPVQIIGNTATAYGSVDIEVYRDRWHNPNRVSQKTKLSWNPPPESVWEELTKTPNASFLYWSRLPFPSTFGPDDELTYTQDQTTLILDMARMFALNKNEYDLSQDLNIMSQIQQAMAQARGTADENDG